MAMAKSGEIGAIRQGKGMGIEAQSKKFKFEMWKWPKVFGFGPPVRWKWPNVLKVFLPGNRLNLRGIRGTELNSSQRRTRPPEVGD